LFNLSFDVDLLYFKNQLVLLHYYYYYYKKKLQTLTIFSKKFSVFFISMILLIHYKDLKNFHQNNKTNDAVLFFLKSLILLTLNLTL